MRKWSIRRTLSRKLLLLFGILWMVGSTLSILFVTIETGELFDNEIKSIAHTLIASKPQGMCLTDVNHDCKLEAIALAGGRASYVAYQIRDRDGHVLHRSINAPEEAFPVPVDAGLVRHGFTRYFTLFYADGKTAVQVAGGAEERFETMGWLLLGMALPMFALLGLGGFFLGRLAKQATAPISDVVHDLMERDGRNLEPISQQGVPEELDPIVRNVNRLMQRLKAALDQERSFSANCAHELRNPLAAAIAQAELLMDADNDRAAPLVSALSEPGHKLERLLQLSRADAGISMTRERTDLVATTQFIVETYLRRDPENERIRFTRGPVIHQHVALDQDALGILIHNLLDNAVKHSPPASPIDVIIEGHATLRVKNVSPVIAPEILSELNRQFVRGNHTVTGDGLGLYIVSQIVAQAQGQMELRSPALGQTDGFEVIVSIPPAINM